MKLFFFLLITLLSGISAGHYTKKCTVTKTQTVRTGGHGSIAYVTQTVTLTQGSGVFTTTEFASAKTMTIKKAQSMKAVSTTFTEKNSSKMAVSVTTTTVTNLDPTASYTTTTTIYTASAISTILLETSDSANNFRIWTGMQLTLLFIGSLIFLI